MSEYCVVDTIFGKVDSVHADLEDALDRMEEIYDDPEHEWDVAYYDSDEQAPGRLCSYVVD